MPTVTTPAAPRAPSRLVRLVAAAMWSPTPRVRRVLPYLLFATVLAVALLTYVSGGTRYAYLHGMYLPIGVAGLIFGPVGGVVAGMVAGLSIGPWMPLDVAAGIAQPLSGWLYRTGFFVLNGVVLGAAAALLRLRLEHVERMRTALGQVYARNLRLFAGLVAERDLDTAGHCERVAQNAVAVGRVLRIPEHQLRQLYWAGLLHDLGKIGVPEAILRKPGRLTSDEYALMKRHASLGSDFLMSVSDAFADIAEGVHAHHERWDGEGYPRRLAGEEIPLFGRVLAVVDVFEAVTSERVYRGPMALEEALELVRSGSGTQFDPAVVQAFLDAFEAGAITRQEAPLPMYDSFILAVSNQRVNVVDLPDVV